MDRLTSWLERDLRSQRDYAQLIDEVSEEVTIYRQPADVSAPGFTAEVASLEPYKTLIIRIEKAKRTPSKQFGDGDVVKGQKSEWVGICLDTDVFIGDELVSDTRRFKIEYVDRRSYGAEVGLKLLTDESNF